MVESKSNVLQMIPHTLFIEWDFGHYSWHCSLDVLLFMELLLAVLLFMELLLDVLLYTSRWHCSWHCSYIRYYSYDHFFFLNVHF